MMSSVPEGLEIYDWNGEGYKPLVFSGDWMVARLNWEPLFDEANLGEIERHSQTDEVFVLWQGQAALFVTTGQSIELVEMTPGTIYNVTRGIWHNLVATRDASWIIVEKRDTHLHDTEIRQMTPHELASLGRLLPKWHK
jgi:mannose-6-phosphate isomerase-like protein (cupin superfamily)